MSRSVFSMVAALSLYREGELFIGAQQIRLLKQVIIDGSILTAAKNLKMSYQNAWHILDRVNRLSPVPVVVRHKGGKDGGGCIITPYGMKLLEAYLKKVREVNCFLEQDNSDLERCFF